MAATDNNIEIAAGVLESILKAALPSLSIPMTSVNWIGAKFTTPNATPWLRTSVFNLGIIDQDASSCYEINRAQFTVGVFYPKGTGRAPMTTGKLIKNLYTAEKFDDVVVEQVTVSPTSEPESSSWFGVNVVVTFTYEGMVA